MAASTNAQSSTSANRASASPRAYLALIGGVLCIGMGPILIRLADVPGEIVGLYRQGIAALVLTLPILLRRRGSLNLSPSTALWGTLGGLMFAGNIFVWSTALNMTTISNATFLDNTAPVWVGLGAWLIFKEKLRPTYWIGVIVALAGAGMLVGIDGFGLDGSQAGLGNLLAFSGAFMYTAYLLISQHVSEQLDNVTYVWLFSGVAALSFLVLALALGTPLTGLPPRSLAALVAVALISQTGGWLLITYALKQLSASLVAVGVLGQPVFATLVAAPLFHEVPDNLQIAGSIVTLVGIVIAQRSSRLPTDG